MIHATFPAALLTAGEATGTTRTVAGVAVPWEVEGDVADGRKVRFARGSLEAAARPLLLRDHDRTRPLGKVTDATDADSGMLVSASVSRTRDGDEALVLAADGVLGAFSVGVNPTRHHYDGDVLVIDAGEWQELSLLTFGAFPGASVASVAASDPEPEIDVPIDDPEEQPEEEDPDPEEEEEPVTTSTELVPAVAASAPAVLPLTGSASAPPGAGPLTLRRVATMVAGANRGEISAQTITTTLAEAKIQAATSTTGALENVLTSDIAGAVQPAYVSEIVGLVERNRATIDHISSAPLPESGMVINYPQWTTLPLVDIQATQKTVIKTGPVAIGLGTANVQTFACGNDVALQAVERSSPSFMEEYFRACGAAYARRTNQFAVAGLLAAATVVPPAATPTWLNSISLLFAALDPNLVPPGPLWVGMSQDVAVTMMGVSVNSGPAFWDASIDVGTFPSEQSGAGLPMFVDWDLPAKTLLMGARSGATWYENSAAPADIRVVDVSLLGVDVGVYGYGALIVGYPKAFAKMTFTGLPAGDEPTTASKK